MFGRAIALILVFGLGTIVASCGDDGGSSSPTEQASPTETPRADLGPAEAVVIIGSPEGTAAGLAQALGAGAPANVYLSGGSRDEASFNGVSLPDDALVKGVNLVAIESETFDAAYEARFDRSPADFAGVREAYDAVYLIVLAAAATNSTDAAAISGSLHYVANPPGEFVTPGAEAFSAALQVLAEGGDVNYLGVSGQADFTVDHDSAKGRVSVWRLLGGDIIGLEIRDVDLAAEIGANVPAGTLSPAAGAPDGPLRIGAVLSLQTDGGAAVKDAMQMAIDEINDAGGLFGEPAELLVESADDTTEPDAAVEALEGQAASAVIGPPDEAVALAAAGAVTGLHIALTSSSALPLQAGGLIFRGAMSDALQAPPLANVALEDEVAVVCVIFEPGASYEVLANAFAEDFEIKGGGVRLVTALAEGNGAGGAISACLGP